MGAPHFTPNTKIAFPVNTERGGKIGVFCCALFVFIGMVASFFIKNYRQSFCHTDCSCLWICHRSTHHRTAKKKKKTQWRRIKKSQKGRAERGKKRKAERERSTTESPDFFFSVTLLSISLNGLLPPNLQRHPWQTKQLACQGWFRAFTPSSPANFFILLYLLNETRKNILTTRGRGTRNVALKKE